jgi:hypothetical protein
MRFPAFHRRPVPSMRFRRVVARSRRALAGAAASCASLLVVPALGAALAQAADPAYKKTALVRFDSTLELAKPAADVWQKLCSAEGFCALGGFKTKAKAKRLEHVGDTVAASVWQDNGVLVCTMAVPGKELRVSWEPENGSYLCHKQVKLEATASGSTRLTFVDRYSDDKLDTVDATAKLVAAETTKALAAFKMLVEGK